MCSCPPGNRRRPRRVTGAGPRLARRRRPPPGGDEDHRRVVPAPPVARGLAPVRGDPVCRNVQGHATRLPGHRAAPPPARRRHPRRARARTHLHPAADAGDLPPPAPAGHRAAGRRARARLRPARGRPGALLQAAGAGALVVADDPRAAAGLLDARPAAHARGGAPCAPRACSSPLAAAPCPPSSAPCPRGCPPRRRSSSTCSPGPRTSAPPGRGGGSYRWAPPAWRPPAACSTPWGACAPASPRR